MTADATNMHPDWDLTEARRIVTEGMRGYPVKVYLFGSRSKGTQRRDSDIDIAILPLAPLPTGLLADIRDRLENSNILYHVDLVDISAVDKAFRDRVIQEGISWNA